MADAVALFLFLSASIPTAAPQGYEKIPVSSILIAGTRSTWQPPSGAFAFGFYHTPNGYAVCVFLAGVEENTVVWTANAFDPILPDDVIALSIELHGLILWVLKNETDRVEYAQIASPSESTAWGAMLDNGNFVLYSSDGGVIWQTFDHPTHALLSGQRLRMGQELISRVSETDLGSGNFRLKMQTDGNLVQYPVNTPDTPENAYYQSGTAGAGKNLSLNLENDGYLHLYDGNSTSYNISGGWTGNHSMYMVRLDPDGIFRLYMNNSEGDWTVIWWSTQDKCAPKGICGVNKFCSYQDQIVNCTCLPGFNFTAASCMEDFNVQDCRNHSVEYEMKTLRSVTWNENYYAVNYTVGEEDCGRACLDDCDCVVALFDDGQCRKQKLPLMYGRNSASVSITTLVRVALPAPAPAAPPPLNAPNGPGSEKGLSDLRKYAIIGVSIGIAVLIISSVIIFYLTKQRLFSSRDEESKQNVSQLVLNHGSLAPKRYSHKEIKKMTKSFAEKLGQGGYGIVYKGWLPDDQLVAVKVLKETHDNAEEFLNEVASISRTSHVNIVNLLGFCLERKKRALVYEFMPNKSLDKFIYRSAFANAECSLEWKKLYEIAVGVARGLEYLHRGCNTRIVHFDIKPQNILLDEEFCPKISDFGLAKLCMKKQSAISMLGTRGTVGYIAPEVFSRNFGVVSHKSDVYSYGIMLLQIVEAKSFKSSDENYFLEKIYKHVLVQNEKVYAVITEEEEEAVRKMLMVGFWCIQTAPSDRPSMNNVVDMLAGNVQSIQIPPLPFLLSSPKLELLPVIIETQSFSDQIL